VENDVLFFFRFSKQMTIEIEQMSARLVEAETKLKTEVTRIKKKLQIQITELEMSLDVANKNNIELQKTIKRYSIQITVGLWIVKCETWPILLSACLLSSLAFWLLSLSGRLCLMG